MSTFTPTPKQVIEAAIYSALGCTDVSSVAHFSKASEHIAGIILSELQRNGFHVSINGGIGIRFNPIGRRFGRLTVSKELPRIRNSKGIPIRNWECLCDCGNTTRVLASQISGKNVRTKSCGCEKREKTIARSLVHGFARRNNTMPEYIAWKAMNRRCAARQGTKDYPYWAARGIKVCDRWKSFEAFLSDMGPRPGPSHSLDRIDVDGNYEPSNCRWATSIEQSRNRRCILAKSSV